MIHNNIDGIGQTFQIVSPNLESFEDGKQFLVMCIIVITNKILTGCDTGAE